MAYNRLSTYKTRVLDFGDGMLGVQYHSTIITNLCPEKGRNRIILKTGGYAGVTTKRKMNQASYQFDLGYSVHQHKHQWFVTTKAGVYPWGETDEFSFDCETGLPWGVVEIFLNNGAEERALS